LSPIPLRLCAREGFDLLLEEIKRPLPS